MSFVYDAFRTALGRDVSGMVLFRDRAMLGHRHRRLVRRVMPGRRGRRAWRLLTRPTAIAWLDARGDPRDRRRVQLVVNTSGIVSVAENDP